MSAPAARLDAITGLRFFAALHVVLFHYAVRTLGATSAVAGHVVSFGFVGVSFFFVLSGFILAYSYAPRAAEGAVAPRPFYASRVARIYPLYLAALLIALPGFLIRISESPDPLWLQGRAR